MEGAWGQGGMNCVVMEVHVVVVVTCSHLKPISIRPSNHPLTFHKWLLPPLFNDKEQASKLPSFHSFSILIIFMPCILAFIPPSAYFFHFFNAPLISYLVMRMVPRIGRGWSRLPAPSPTHHVLESGGRGGRAPDLGRH